LNEARDGKTQEYKVINWLLRRVRGYAPGQAAAWWSTAIGRGDVLTSGTSGAEVIGLTFQLPTAFPSFNLNFAGEVKDSASGGVFRVRLGGTVGVATSGTVVATLTASSTSYVYATVTVPISANLQTLVTMTLQSTAGHTASFANGFLLGN
jgi:antitoxin (DNA-binding transcriptional repressor) of toxin-antitoxin stability system